MRLAVVVFSLVVSAVARTVTASDPKGGSPPFSRDIPRALTGSRVPSVNKAVLKFQCVEASMLLRAIVVVYLFASFSAIAQSTPSAPSAPTSDPMAIALANKAIVALGIGATSVNDVTIDANVISIYGSDYETGTGTFSAKGPSLSRVDLNLSGGTRSDVRSQINGVPSGAWSQNGSPSKTYAQSNAWTDAAWFFPGFSSLAQVAQQHYVFKYIGPEQHGGISVQHIQAFQVLSNDTAGTFQRLSTVDIYLDATTFLPAAVATNTHPDNDPGTNIPVEVRFTNYQKVNGVLVPFHFQQMFNGGVVLDATVVNVAFNTGLPNSLFILP